MSLTALATSEPRVDHCQGFISHLVLRCAQGDEAALGDLFDLTFFLVAGALSRDARSSLEADDEVVNAFWRIWHRSPTYEPAQQDVLAWVLGQVLDGHATA